VYIALAVVGLFLIVGVAGVFVLLQLDDSPEGLLQAEGRQAPLPPAPPPEPWASKPPREWPQLVLTNHAEFKGHTGLEGASAFLIRSGDGRTLAATARHLIGENGGVEPEIPVAALDGVIHSWRMYPRTLPDQFVMADKLVAGLADEDLDWLILAIKKTSKPLPATPLRLRPSPVQVGDKVYVVGCPYEEEDCKQNVYVGKVTARSGNLFRYDLSPPENIRGFSGAPVLDQNGHVAGVMTVWFKPRMQGENYLEAGGEDAAAVYDLVEEQR
jgi:S1-C subfamily serine protease